MRLVFSFVTISVGWKIRIRMSWRKGRQAVAEGWRNERLPRTENCTETLKDETITSISLPCQEIKRFFTKLMIAFLCRLSACTIHRACVLQHKDVFVCEIHKTVSVNGVSYTCSVCGLWRPSIVCVCVSYDLLDASTRHPHNRKQNEPDRKFWVRLMTIVWFVNCIFMRRHGLQILDLLIVSYAF